MTDTLNIFISHKHEDAVTARGIASWLTKLTEDEKLNVFLSEEIVAGDDWFDWIRRRLGDSNLLLLLFTDVTKSWDWCLYEAGLFEDLDADKANDPRRVVCLNGVDHIPGPLKHLQAVDSSAPSVKKFLTDLYLGIELTGFAKPLSPWLAKVTGAIDEAAEGISQLIARKPVKQRHFGRFVFVHIPDPRALESGVIPPDARVESDANSLRTLFDKFEDQWVWRDLEQEARRNRDNRWIGELSDAIHRFSEGKPPHPIQATFRARGNDQIYRPVLYRVDSLADGSAVFKVLFHEDVSWQLADIPDALGNLLTSLSMATRFRYEVLEKYSGKIHGMDEAARDRACAAIVHTVSNIEEEADSRGLLEKEGLVEVFESSSSAEIANMYARWYEIRETLLRGLEERDGETVDLQLEALNDINRRYLDIATKRLAELMAASNETQTVTDLHQVQHRAVAPPPAAACKRDGSGLGSAAEPH